MEEGKLAKEGSLQIVHPYSELAKKRKHGQGRHLTDQRSNKNAPIETLPSLLPYFKPIDGSAWISKSFHFAVLPLATQAFETILFPQMKISTHSTNLLVLPLALELVLLG
ncbi:MAG: hypothetical protein MI807_11805 [Verrucomicrobiales bacterium]|nr:hypothetical protein [Verrucomicrobiales bacterium]